MIRADLPGVSVVFSSRNGGVSEGPYESLNLGILTDDTADRVAENRSILAHRAGLDPASVAMGWQVHGTELKEWQEPPKGDGGYAAPGADLPRVDGHLTSRPGTGLLVLVADCLPVALAGEGQAAMLHCGWRGLAGGIIDRALESFEGPVAAAIGPGIGPCCYEVGEEVLAAFADVRGAPAGDGRMLDLRAVARAQLEAGGARVQENVDLCTSCRPDLFFSHRRDHGVTGRQAGLAWIPAG